jgi:hypothetical protein
MVARLHCLKLLAAAAAACIVLSTYAIAGQRGSSGSGYSGRHQASDRSAQREYRQDNRGTEDRQRDEVAGADADQAGDSEQSRETREGSRSERGSGFFNARGDEKVVETREQKADARSEKSEARSERSELSKKFDSSLLLADVAPNASANKSGPTNNPGLDHMSAQGLQHSEAGRTKAQNAIEQNGSAHPNIPAGNHNGWRRGEHNPHRALERRERLPELEKQRLETFLKAHLRESQVKRLHEVLEGGLTREERHDLNQFLDNRFGDGQEEKLRNLLQDIFGD